MDGQVPDGRGGWVARFYAMHADQHLTAIAIGVLVAVVIVVIAGWWINRVSKQESN